MIPAVAQTLAEILAGGTSLLSTEQIDFNHPGLQEEAIYPRLNLYCYDLRASASVEGDRRQLGSQSQGSASKNSLIWFDISFLVSAWDRTALGEQRLLSEALALLLPLRSLAEDFLPPALRSFGNLPVAVSAIEPSKTAALWSALGVPLRPAFHVTVTIPINLSGATANPKCDRRGNFTDTDPIKATVSTSQPTS